jgi:CRP-like cAMP-binding protein
MGIERLFEVLSALHPLSPDFKEALGKECRAASFPKGHHLLQAHTAAYHAFFLVKGFAVGFRYQGTQRVVTDFWQSGEIVFSPKSFFEQSTGEDIIELTVDSDLLSLSHTSFVKLVDAFPVAGRLARDITADYYARSEERIVDLHTLDAWERYTKLIEIYPRIEMSVSQELIASYLGITPSTLSRLKAGHS